jgi:DNA-binding PadR family transcriptional regulator
MQKENSKKRNTAGEIPRLSETEFLIMSLLTEAGKDTYGLELVQKSDGKLKKGSVYVLLGRLEDKGFVEGRFEVEGSAIPRKLYKATGQGRKVFQAWQTLMEIGGLRGAFAA